MPAGIEKPILAPVWLLWAQAICILISVAGAFVHYNLRTGDPTCDDAIAPTPTGGGVLLGWERKQSSSSESSNGTRMPVRPVYHDGNGTAATVY
jgi:hypothetical protein